MFLLITLQLKSNMSDNRIKSSLSATQFYYLNKELVYARQRVCHFKRKVKECKDQKKLAEYKMKLEEWENKVSTYTINHV